MFIRTYSIKGMHTIFSEKGEKTGKKGKKGKIFLNLGKNLQKLKYLEKKAGDCVKLSHAMHCRKRPSLFNCI